jgi:hypothetical protein
VVFTKTGDFTGVAECFLNTYMGRQ